MGGSLGLCPQSVAVPPMLTRIPHDDPAQERRPSRAEIEEYRDEDRQELMKLQFGNRTVADCVDRLKDPKVLAGAKECLAAGRATWCMPVQLRAFDEETIRAAVGMVEG